MFCNRSFPLNAASQLPQSETLSRSIRRQRQVPSANSNNQLPDHLKQTDRGEKFLLHEDKELIMFTTASNLSMLKAFKHWFADGTFKARSKKRVFYLFVISLLQVCPDDFYQMFTLQWLFKSQIIPLIYGLLVGKNSTDYERFFQCIGLMQKYPPIF